MTINPKSLENLRPAKKGEVRNPKGKAKGTKHISTWIQNMLNDEDFETSILDSKKGLLEFKGAPLEAIIKVAIHKAIHDKDKGAVWAEWLAKHGYGSKLVIETDSPLKQILDKFGIGEGEDAGEAEGTSDGTPTERP